VAITHFHYDHVADLPALVVALRWGQLPARTAPLTVIGPPGFRDWLVRLGAVLGDWVTSPGTYEVRIIELDRNGTLPLSFDPPVAPDQRPAPVLSAFPVPHTPESVAYSVTSGRARLVYTGDTGYDDALGDWAAGCSVLLSECSLPASLAIPEHLTPESAGALAARARPGRLVLTHFYPPVEREDIRALVGERWSGPIDLAVDGSVIEIEE
jgi:ribonuclease BN (tRNA processing enzyme)